MFLIILLATAARPEAALQLTRERCDVSRRLVDLNPADREQTKKRRPVLPMPDFFRPWVESVAAGPLVTYRGEPVQKINAVWRATRERAGLDPSVVPYSIRHTVATEMRTRGVPELEIAGFLGHSMPNFRTTGRYAKYAPDTWGRRARRLTTSQTKSAGLWPGRWYSLTSALHSVPTQERFRQPCVPVAF